jgi:hypothetical protein
VCLELDEPGNDLDLYLLMSSYLADDLALVPDARAAARALLGEDVTDLVSFLDGPQLARRTPMSFLASRLAACGFLATLPLARRILRGRT